MKLIKNYIQYEADGYTAERKIVRESDGTITFTTSAEINLIPFAMDLEHEEFIIFMIPQKTDANLYLWVYIGKESNEKDKPSIMEKNRITAINDLMQFTKWTGEAMDVSGKYGDDVIHKALIRLQECSDGEIWEMLKASEKRFNDVGGPDFWKKEEKHILEMVKKAKKDYKGIMYMY